MQPEKKGLLEKVGDTTYKFASTRMQGIFRWAGFFDDAFSKTTLALVRLPVYGLFNPMSMRPSYQRRDAFVEHSILIHLYEFIAHISSFVAGIAGYIGGLGVGVVFGGLFGLRPESFFGTSSSSNGTANSRYIADYLNNPVMRQSVVRFGLLGLVGSTAILGLSILGSSLSAGMTLGAASAAVVAALPLMLPITLSVAAMGVGIGVGRGIVNQWHVNRVTAIYHKKFAALAQHDEKTSPEVAKLLRALADIYFAAVNGDSAATAQLNVYDVENSITVEKLKSEIFRTHIERMRDMQAPSRSTLFQLLKGQRRDINDLSTVFNALDIVTVLYDLNKTLAELKGRVDVLEHTPARIYAPAADAAAAANFVPGAIDPALTEQVKDTPRVGHH